MMYEFSIKLVCFARARESEQQQQQKNTSVLSNFQYVTNSLCFIVQAQVQINLYSLSVPSGTCCYQLSYYGA
jgi:hypothetical protein